MPKTPSVLLEDILTTLNDKNYKARRDAIKLLGKYKTYQADPRIMPALIKATKDSTLTVTMAAMRVMGKRGDPQGLEALPNVLKRPHSCSFSRAIQKWVLGYGSTAVPHLIQAFDNPKPDIRRSALWLLAELKALEAFDVFLRALHDPDHTVQTCAIYRLASLGDRRAVGPLLDMMHSDDFDLPANAAHAIGQLLGIEAVDHLLPMLQHRAAKMREAAIHTLGIRCASDPRVAPAISELFADKNLGVRNAAVRFFSLYPHAFAKPLLIDVLNDPQATVRANAVDALRALDTHDPEIIENLQQILVSESDEIVRRAINYSLSQMVAELEPA